MRQNTIIMVSTQSGDIAAVHYNITETLGADIMGVLDKELFIKVKDNGNGYSLQDLKRKAREAAADAVVMIGDFEDGEIIPYEIPIR